MRHFQIPHIFLLPQTKSCPKGDKSVIAQHLKDLLRSFSEYFPVPESSKKIALVNVNELWEFTAVEEDKF